MSDPRIVNAAAELTRRLPAFQRSIASIASNLERMAFAHHDPEATQLLDAGWWRAVNAEGEERWIDDGGHVLIERNAALEIADRKEAT
jgi:hypothetical protein